MGAGRGGGGCGGDCRPEAFPGRGLHSESHPPVWHLADVGVRQPWALRQLLGAPGDSLALSEPGVLSGCESAILISGMKAPGQRAWHGHAPYLTATSVSWADVRNRGRPRSCRSVPCRMPRGGQQAGGRSQEHIAFLRFLQSASRPFPLVPAPFFCGLSSEASEELNTGRCKRSSSHPLILPGEERAAFVPGSASAAFKQPPTLLRAPFLHNPLESARQRPVAVHLGNR